MLSRRYHCRRHCFLQLRIPLVLVRRKRLLDPFDVVRLAFTRELDRVWEGERHVTVDHDRKIGSHGLAPLLHGGDVFPFATRKRLRRDGGGGLGGVRGKTRGASFPRKGESAADSVLREGTSHEIRLSTRDFFSVLSILVFLLISF